MAAHRDWLETNWLLVVLSSCAEVSAIWSVVRLRQKKSIALNVIILVASLDAYVIAGFVALLSNGLLWWAGCSVGIVFVALAIATGRELMQKRAWKPAIESRYAAINRFRQAGPTTALMIAALASLPLVILAFKFIDHAMWVRSPSDPGVGDGTCLGWQESVRLEILLCAFLVCGSLYNLAMCVVLSVYHGRLWRGVTAAILLSFTVLFAVGAEEHPLWRAARMYLLKYSSVDIGDLIPALGTLCWFIIPSVFAFLLITHYRLAATRG
jgi:hypothetical protein